MPGTTTKRIRARVLRQFERGEFDLDGVYQTGDVKEEFEVSATIQPIRTPIEREEGGEKWISEYFLTVYDRRRLKPVDRDEQKMSDVVEVNGEIYELLTAFDYRHNGAIGSQQYELAKRQPNRTH